MTGGKQESHFHPNGKKKQRYLIDETKQITALQLQKEGLYKAF